MAPWTLLVWPTAPPTSHGGRTCNTELDMGLRQKLVGLEYTIRRNWGQSGAFLSEMLDLASSEAVVMAVEYLGR